MGVRNGGTERWFMLPSVASKKWGVRFGDLGSKSGVSRRSTGVLALDYSGRGVDQSGV